MSKLHNTVGRLSYEKSFSVDGDEAGTGSVTTDVIYPEKSTLIIVDIHTTVNYIHIGNRVAAISDNGYAAVRYNYYNLVSSHIDTTLIIEGLFLYWPQH